MGVIVLPGFTRYTQPQSGAQIDRSNPIARGLVFLSSQHNPYDLVSGVFGAPGGSGINKVITPQGIGANLVGGTSNIVFGTQDIGNVTGAITCLSFGLISNSSADLTAISKCPASGGSNTPFDFGTATGGVLRLGRANSGFRMWSSAATTSTTKAQIIAATQGSAIEVAPKFYIDGKLDTGAATNMYGGSGSGAPTTTTAQIRAMNRGDAATPYFGNQLLTAVWNRELSAAEIASISANPWQLFKSPQRVMLAAAGVATYSYTATGGITFAGTSAAIRSALKTPAGGVVFSGTAPQLRGTVRTAAGGISMAGTAAQIRGRSITASGGIVLAGTASMLRGAVRAAAGGIVLAGTSAVSFFSAVQSLVVTPVGGIVFGGSAAIVRTCTRLVSGGITFRGTSAVEFFSILSTGASDWIGYIRRRGRR